MLPHGSKAPTDEKLSSVALVSLLNVRNKTINMKTEKNTSDLHETDSYVQLFGIKSVSYKVCLAVLLNVGMVLATVGGSLAVCDCVFKDKRVSQSSSHTRSELIVVLGEVFSIVGGLTSYKHVPVLKDLLFGQLLILKR